MDTNQALQAIADELITRREKMLASMRTFYIREQAGTYVNKKDGKTYPHMRPIACVAYLLNDDQDPTVALFAVSQCSRKDDARRFTGRYIAIERLHKARKIEMVPAGPGLHRRIIDKILSAPYTTKRTRAAVEAWLKSHPAPELKVLNGITPRTASPA